MLLTRFLLQQMSIAKRVALLIYRRDNLPGHRERHARSDVNRRGIGADCTNRLSPCFEKCGGAGRTAVADTGSIQDPVWRRTRAGRAGTAATSSPGEKVGLPRPH